jgi:hypothetical protein
MLSRRATSRSSTTLTLSESEFGCALKTRPLPDNAILVRLKASLVKRYPHSKSFASHDGMRRAGEYDDSQSVA